MAGLTKNDVEDLLLNVIGVTKICQWKGSKIQYTCLIHGDTRPSAGIDIDCTSKNGLEHQQYFHCFSCGEGGNLAWLLYRSLPDQFRNLKEAKEFIESRYNVKIGSIDTKTLKLKRYDDLSVEEERFEIPLSKIAPFKSGKETYEYFYTRGFTRQVVKDFMIGRDLVNETVTVPIFWDDRKLCGVIGRYINPNRPKDDRFKIYDFPKGSILYPLDKFIPNEKGEIILVEGLFDAIRMHMLGYTNTLTTFTNSISSQQINLLTGLGTTIIDCLDNDERGREGVEHMKKTIGDKMRWKSVKFPDYGKDPMDWEEEDIHKLVASCKDISINISRYIN